MDQAPLSFLIRATRLTPLPTGSFELVLTLTPTRAGKRQGHGGCDRARNDPLDDPEESQDGPATARRPGRP
jgi:hypothetical protein